MSGSGLVSRVSPVQTALRNCTRDEGRSFEVGNQVLIASHRKPAALAASDRMPPPSRRAAMCAPSGSSSPRPATSFPSGSASVAC